MSPEQTPAKVITPSVPKEFDQIGQEKKLKQPPPPEHHVKCPRCDSPNTKFCYYNNYSLSQPRHFCKTCRRYWTKGGALRNVPVGGGCRKNQKMIKQRSPAGISNSRDSSSGEVMGSSNGGELNFFQGFLTPAMDFQHSSINPPLNFSLYDPYHNTSQLNYSHHPISSAGAVGTNLMGFGCQRGGGGDAQLNGTQQMGTGNKNSMIVHSNLASSIESLSSINQELHWKLQQQRLVVLLSGDQTENPSTQTDLPQVQHQFNHHDHQQPQSQTLTQNLLLQPVSFRSSLDTSKEAADPWKGAQVPAGKSTRRLSKNDGITTEWFFDANPYTNRRRNTTRGLINEDNNMVNQEVNDDNNQNGNWNIGIHAWSDLQPYSESFTLKYDPR